MAQKNRPLMAGVTYGTEVLIAEQVAGQTTELEGGQ